MVYHHRTALVRLLSWRLQAIANRTRPVFDDVLEEDSWFNQVDTEPSSDFAVKYRREIRKQARCYLKILGVVRQNVEADDFEIHTLRMIEFCFAHADMVWGD